MTKSSSVIFHQIPNTKIEGQMIEKVKICVKLSEMKKLNKDIKEEMEQALSRKTGQQHEDLCICIVMWHGGKKYGEEYYDSKTVN